MEYLVGDFGNNFSCWRLCYYLLCMMILHGWYLSRVKGV